jgi:hypothetical protein
MNARCGKSILDRDIESENLYFMGNIINKKIKEYIIFSEYMQRWGILYLNLINLFFLVFFLKSVKIKIFFGNTWGYLKIF